MLHKSSLPGYETPRAMRALHSTAAAGGGLLLIMGVLLAGVCYNLLLTTQLQASMRVLHEQLHAGSRPMGHAMASQSSKTGAESAALIAAHQMVASPRASPPAAPSPAAPVTPPATVQPQALQAVPNHEPRGLYLGDGKVFCYAAPLGRPMILEGADKGITVHLCRGLGWEPETSDVFRRLVKQGDYVLDVGANVGYFTLLFSDLVGPHGRVLAVEAQPRTWDLVATTVEFNGLGGRTQVINKAAFETDGKTLQIGASKSRPLNNALNLDGKQAKEETVPVETITIDTGVAEWKRLDFVKIDVEGAEAHAYAGMQNTWKRFPNLILIMEVNTARMGADKALNFYNQLAKDFPQLRKLSGRAIIPTTVQELHANRGSDDMVVLTHRSDVA